MMSTPRHLPGFYYDAEKRRYFPIQPDHQAPSGVAYSRSAVNASKAIAKQANVLVKRQNREKSRIHRINPASHTGISLYLRHGGHNVADLLAHTYATNLQSRCARTQPRDSISALALNRGRLYCGIKSAAHNVWCLNERRPRRLFTVYADGQGWPRFGLSFAGEGCIAAYLGPELYISALQGGTSTSVRIADTIWDIAGSIEPIIVVATTEGLTIHDIASTSTSPTSRRTHQGLPHKEQMVVTFQDPHTVISGQRSGRVNFTDIRASGTAYRLHHSNAVNGITTAKTTNHIIVSGLETTSIYDLRYAKPAHSLNPPGQRYGKNKKAARSKSTSSQPFVRFYVPPERQSTHYGTGKSLAYLTSHDIAILASHRAETTGLNRQNKITLYQCSTGRVLPSPIADATSLPAIKDLTVGRIRDGPESILVATSTRLYEWNVDLPYDPDVIAKTVPQPKPHPLGWTRDDGAYLIGQDCFPPDSQPDMSEKWLKGDEGPG